MTYIDIDPSTTLPALPDNMKFTYTPYHVAIMETLPDGRVVSVAVEVKRNPENLSGTHLRIAPEEVAGLAEKAYKKMLDTRVTRL